uniref:Uncharacterized protein n=1 Tax=viral metagenome TaxID=1070528 RepID=A0A6C0KM28_9ZZZZ
MFSACWPANVVGAFFIAILIIDTVCGYFLDLPYHGIVGIVLTCIFWLVCSTFGEAISGAILLVPAIFLLAVLFNTIINKDVDDCGCSEKKFVIHFRKKPEECIQKPKPKCVNG